MGVRWELRDKVSCTPDSPSFHGSVVSSLSFRNGEQSHPQIHGGVGDTESCAKRSAHALRLVLRLNVLAHILICMYGVVHQNYLKYANISVPISEIHIT